MAKGCGPREKTAYVGLFACMNKAMRSQQRKKRKETRKEVGNGGLMDQRNLVYKLPKKEKEIMYSVYPSTRPPDLNLVLTEMDSSLVN